MDEHGPFVDGSWWFKPTKHIHRFMWFPVRLITRKYILSHWCINIQSYWVTCCFDRTDCTNPQFGCSQLQHVKFGFSRIFPVFWVWFRNGNQWTHKCSQFCFWNWYLNHLKSIPCDAQWGWFAGCTFTAFSGLHSPSHDSRSNAAGAE